MQTMHGACTFVSMSRILAKILVFFLCPILKFILNIKFIHFYYCYYFILFYFGILDFNCIQLCFFFLFILVVLDLTCVVTNNTYIQWIIRFMEKMVEVMSSNTNY